jgi:hypothetical protein
MDTTWIATHSDGTACDRATTTHDCPANHRYTHTEWLEADMAMRAAIEQDAMGALY